MAQGSTDNRSIGELMRELRDESSALLRQEAALAKTEMSEKLSSFARQLLYAATGALVTLLGGIFILRAISEGIALGLREAGYENLAPWLAPLIVGVFVGIVGYALVRKAVSTLEDETLVPEKTVDSLTEGKQWLKQKAT